MAASVEIVFRKDKINKKQQSPLHVRITKNRRVKYIATGFKMESKFWDHDRKKAKSSYPNSVRFNNYLNTIKVKYQNEVLIHETQDTTISSRQLKKKITGNNDTDFFIVASEVIKKYKTDDKTRTYKKACSIVQKIKDFIGRDKLPMEG